MADRYWGLSDIVQCVICGGALSQVRKHVDTCGARCFKALLRRQRAALDREEK